MSIPEKESATQQEPPAQVEKPEPTTEEKLETAEQRRKDTQSAFTKGQQALKAKEAENAKLLEQISILSKVEVSAEDQKRLDELKFDNPDEWRKEVNSLEDKAKKEHAAKIAELTGTAREEAEVQFELERRQQVLTDFNESSETAITPELIANEVPPRITKKLEEGTITFEEFLNEVSVYVGTGKAVKNSDTLGQPNLGNLGGGHTPKDMKPEGSLSNNYASDIY